MPKTNEGLIKKFNVSRVDGKNPDAMYFVLDIDNDPLARIAAQYYAHLAGRAGYIKLMRDLNDYIDKNPLKHKEPSDGHTPEAV